MIREHLCRIVGRTPSTLFHASQHLHHYRCNAGSKRLFDSGTKLDLFRDTSFELARNYALILQAWAFFANHYHLVVSFENTKATHRDFVRHLHRELAMRSNRADATSDRRVMYEPGMLA